MSKTSNQQLVTLFVPVFLNDYQLKIVCFQILKKFQISQIKKLLKIKIRQCV